MTDLACNWYDDAPIDRRARLRRDERDEPGPVPTTGSLKGGSFVVDPGPGALLCQHIETPLRAYTMRGTFILDIFEEPELVHVKHRVLPLEGFGDSLEEALDDLALAFDVQWEDLVEADEGLLTPAAQVIRSMLLREIAAAPLDR